MRRSRAHGMARSLAILATNWFAIVLCLCATRASAADLIIGMPGGSMAIDLHFARDEVDLRVEDGAEGTGMRLSRAGIAYAETFGKGLSMGLVGGYVSASQDGQEVSRGMRLTGSYVGVNLRGVLPLARRISMGATGQFIYHWMDDASEGQKVELDWAQSDIAAFLQASVGSLVTLYAGPVYSEIRVEQRARGPIDSTTDLEGRRTSGVVGGVLIEVDHQGWVGLEVRQGPLDGVALSFQRGF